MAAGRLGAVAFVAGLPFGLSFFGRECREPKRLRLAYAFGQGAQMRGTPRFLATVG